MTARKHFHLNADQLLNAVCSLLSCFGILMVVLAVTSVLCPLFNIYIVYPFVPAAYLFGWAAMIAINHLTGWVPPEDDTYESVTEFFDKRRAAIPLALVTAACISAFFAFREYYAAHLAAFDVYSLQPYLCPILLLLAGAAGIFVGGCPWKRLVSIPFAASTAIAGFVLAILADNIFGVKMPQVGGYFAVYAICCVVLMNQRHITKATREITVGIISPSARLYNMRLVLILLAAASLGVGIAYLGVKLVTALGLYLAYTVLMLYLKLIGMLLADSEDAEKASKAAGELSMMEGFDGWLALTALLLLAFFLFLKFAGNTRTVRKLKFSLLEFLAGFLGLLMGKYSPASGESESVIHTATAAELVKQRAKNAADQVTSKPDFTLRDFDAQFFRLKSDDERLSYAYLVMVRVLADRHDFISESDTPREIEAKLAHLPEYSKLHEITLPVEQLKYADIPADAEKIKGAIVCIRRILENIL